MRLKTGVSPHCMHQSIELFLFTSIHVFFKVVFMFFPMFFMFHVVVHTMEFSQVLTLPWSIGYGIVS